jgi:hypothetical protein
MDPVRILRAFVIDYLNNHPIDGEGLTSFEEPEGDENEAEVRIGWGGKDLFDITIKRV